jgi:hypothetical protein
MSADEIGLDMNGPGYVKDHVKALACGGPDSVANLQWQTRTAARAKDRWERQTCDRR